MKKIRVSASGSYDVWIGSGILSATGEQTAKVIRGRKLCIVSDDKVAPLYEGTVRRSLEEAGFEVCTYVFPHGEQSKNGETFLELMNFLAEHRLTRADGLVALGGGVTGDLTGFAAACYLRGVDYVQIPTSLLAMVDSSVGGKTAIDLPAGKNLCGAFHQPVLVVCDTDVLVTLPEKYYRDGCAEIIKCGILGDKILFETLKNGVKSQEEAVISTCIAMKRDLVEEDEFDNGRRQFLNLGHTLGHAIEIGSDFSLTHGQAISVGMAMIAKAAQRKGFCTEETAEEIISLLRKYDLPTETEIPPEEICRLALGDKKRRGGTLTLIVPTEIGNCILQKIPVEELQNWLPVGNG